MEFLTIIFIAVGLAMDAFAVSVVSGSLFKKLNVRHALQIAVFFGGFQALMPIIGSLAGLTVRDHIADYDHWIAFGLLAVVGGKMIYESFKMKPERQNFDPSSIAVLFMLSIATSIDALAVGFTISFIKISIIISAAVIGLVTFILSYCGVFIGKKFGHFFENKIEIAGGIILICIGLKILIQDLAL